MLLKGGVVRHGGGRVFDMPVLKKMDSGSAVSVDVGRTTGRRSEELEREAYEKGFEVGEKAGLEMGRQKAAVQLDRLEKIISEFQVLRQQVVSEIEPQIMDLAMTIARRILTEELSVRPELVVAMTKEALRRVEKNGTITIRMNPSLHDLFTRVKPQLLELHPDIVFEPDPAVSVSGAVIIAQKEEVLTDIDLQLKNVRDSIEGNLGSH